MKAEPMYERMNVYELPHCVHGLHHPVIRLDVGIRGANCLLTQDPLPMTGNRLNPQFSTPRTKKLKLQKTILTRHCRCMSHSDPYYNNPKQATRSGINHHHDI